MEKRKKKGKMNPETNTVFPPSAPSASNLPGHEQVQPQYYNQPAPQQGCPQQCLQQGYPQQPSEQVIIVVQVPPPQQMHYNPPSSPKITKTEVRERMRSANKSFF